MPQILHSQQQDDRCSQTYPQKMGIDNSHAVEQHARKIAPNFFFEQRGGILGREVVRSGGRPRTNVWEEHAPIESDRYGGDLGRTLGFPVQAGPAHHPQRSIPWWTTFPLGV